MLLLFGIYGALDGTQLEPENAKNTLVVRIGSSCWVWVTDSDNETYEGIKILCPFMSF